MLRAAQVEGEMEIERLDDNGDSSPDVQVLRMARDDLHDALLILNQTAKSKRRYVSAARKKSTKPENDQVILSTKFDNC